MATTWVLYWRSLSDQPPNNPTPQLTVAWGTHYLPPITKRLNKLIPGANLTDADSHGALYACAYDTAAYGIDKSPWCGVFSQPELLNFE